jgi:DNA repair protein RecN (Recombination protein N)
MIESLHISNYALIDNIDIAFKPGLNIITGETGAGKSIMLGALSLLLGARADMKSVRNADRKTVIEAVFGVGEYPALKSFCEENDIEWDDNRCILRREIAPAGRSRAFVNDSPVPLAKLEAVSMQLIDIHSQHQNQLLTRPDFQLRVIDTLAGNEARLETYRTLFNTFRDALRKLKVAKARIERTRDDEEFTRFQLEQLDELDLTSGEQEELEKERDVMANLTDIKSTLYTALQALREGRFNAISLVDDTLAACMSLDSVLSADDAITDRLESAMAELSDIADTLSSIDGDLSADPEELESIESRLQAIYSLQHKHKVDTVDELIAIRERLRERLDALDSSDITLASLEKEARRALALAKEAAAEISAHRKDAAQKFAAQLTELAAPLGMKNLRTQVNVSPADISATGTDKVEFAFAFNKNQPLLPVAGIASGGEISRLMLCLKAIIAEHMSLPTIIFDEIDTGVSGDVAARIGAMMQRMGSSIQVITITHLPQVAARGSSHFKVFKQDDDSATHTRVAELSPDDRIAELALMLSGNPDDPAARATAQGLLNQTNP